MHVFERNDLFTRGLMTAYINLSTVLMTQPKANETKVFSFDYVIKEVVNVAAMQSCSYGWTWEVC